MKAGREALLTWHAQHHGGQNPPLEGWETTRRSAIQGICCTGCQVWPLIVELHKLITKHEATRVALAAYAHEAWSEDTTWKLAQGTKQPDGSVLLPALYVQNLERLAQTPYAELSEEQKNNDRREADRMLAIFHRKPADD